MKKMSHLTFYRKYRQKRFADLAGQDHIKAVLLGGLQANKVAHAYLFCGPRGTGKTTSARIFAKAVNCQNLQDGEPCNQCPSCQLVDLDKTVDIIEIDAASNRGIDEIRDLRERVNFPPQALKKKIYIIDEVHMLTPEAFNALLKTLEEPPDHVIFILATTEAHKVPTTIQSRAQRLNFHLGTPKQIAAHLREVADKEKLDITPEAIDLIALNADGGFRDGLSFLEQVAVRDQEINDQLVREVLGLAEAQAVTGLLAAIFENDAAQALSLLDQLIEKGTSPLFLHRLLVEETRKVLRQELGILPKEQMTSFGQEKIIQILEDLLAITQTIRTSPLPFLPLEIIVAKNTTKEAKIVKPTDSLPMAAEPWQQVLADLKNYNHSLTEILRGGQTEQNQNQLIVRVKYQFHSSRLMEAKNRQKIEEMIEKAFGKKLVLNCQVAPPVAKNNKEAKNEEDLLVAAKEILG